MNDKRTTVSDEIDALAQEIRRVDGENSLGAGALAEALQPFLTELPHRREAEAAYVSVREMKLSPGADGEPRSDFFVSIKVGDREVTPHMFRERFKSEYHVALYDWLLNGGDEPELMAFSENEWPARKLGPELAASPSSPASGVRVSVEGILEMLETAQRLRDDHLPNSTQQAHLWEKKAGHAVRELIAREAAGETFGPVYWPDELRKALGGYRAAHLSALGEHP